MKRLLLAALILTLAGVGAGFTQIPHGTVEPVLPATPRGCFPVDAMDARDDRDTGEVEGALDEDEISCVPRKKYEAIRRELGLAK